MIQFWPTHSCRLCGPLFGSGRPVQVVDNKDVKSLSASYDLCTPSSLFVVIASRRVPCCGNKPRRLVAYHSVFSFLVDLTCVGGSR